MADRFTFDRDNRVITGQRRRPTARKYLTADAERIIADCYPGEVLAVVIERAVRTMAIRDGRLIRKPSKPSGNREAST